MNELSMWGHFVNAMNKFFVFKGRASRKEYWSFVLFYIIFMAIAGLVLGMMDLPDRVLNSISYVFLVPSIAVTVRRLHDLNKSGAWYFIQLIPIVGTLYLLYLMLKPTQQGDNKYGPSLV
ncbi:DUF805 domain-containing protein [Veillonella agrestimuris]|uniref:DUF805 domain-containing protein n=1 Tax=Veillonella agrestimuris TaxID=2941340 RepID=UPI00203AF2CB|nr:DUF805 domain-containing protein [Veillonella agrestimuris]